MFLGRYPKGGFVPLPVPTATTPGVPTLPTAAPVVRVYDSSGAFVETFSIPIRDRYGTTAFFLGRLRLGAKYSAGIYHVRAAYTVSTAKAQIFAFEVLAEGHLDGAVIALHAFKAAAATWAIGQCDGGRIIRKRNPKVPT